MALARNDGFCPGNPNQFVWEAPRPDGMQFWTTLCGSPAAPGTSIALTQNFRAPAHLALFLLGWLRPDQQAMWLQNVQTGAKMAVRLDEVPGGGWHRLAFNVPKTWRGQLVRLQVETARTGDLTWVGFSEPLDAGPLRDYWGALNLLLRLSESYLLLSCVFLSAVALALRANIEDVCLLVFFGLAAAGAAGYLAFWGWLLVPKLGHLFSVLVPLAGAAHCVWWWRAHPAKRGAFFEVAKPWLLAFSVALFILSAGFLYGGVEFPLITPGTRFSHQIPMDNALQYLLAQQILAHHVQHPMILDWLSSDRPPLETGFTLFQIPFIIPPRALAYQVLSVLLQSFWAPALWAFLSAFQIARWAVRWTLVAAVFSGFVMVNSFFVWPKLLAAAYMLGFAMLLLVPRYFDVLQRRKSVALLTGSLFALGMLSHGGSAFAVLGLAPALLLLRRRIPFRAMLPAAVAFLAFYLPWMAYQKFVDPPGDRLLKMHLAGVDKPTSDSVFTVLRQAYKRASWAGVIEAREENLQTMWGPQETYWKAYWQFVQHSLHDLTHAEETAAPPSSLVRLLEFFHFFPALDILLFGLPCLAAGIWKRFRNDLWRAAAMCWTYVLCTLAMWCITMFVPKGAIIVSGTYVANLLAITGCVLALAALSRWLAAAVVCWHAAVVFLLYVVYGRSAPPGVITHGVLQNGELILLIFALALLLFGILTDPQRARAGQTNACVSMNDSAVFHTTQ